jgi:predicted nucleotidyltransferase
LAATFLAPDRWWYQSDLARQLGTTSSALQRELDRLAALGVLRRRKDGNRVYFQANRDCPYFAEIEGLMVKTAGLADVLREALVPFAPAIRVAFVYGSFARAEEHAESDVDLLVIGNAGLAEIAPRLRLVERRVGRPVNPSVYTTREWARCRAKKNHFVESVLGEPKLFLLGGLHESETAGLRSRALSGIRPITASCSICGH